MEAPAVTTGRQQMRQRRFVRMTSARAVKSWIRGLSQRNRFFIGCSLHFYVLRSQASIWSWSACFRRSIPAFCSSSISLGR